jgi:hypothetical protein
MTTTMNEENATVIGRRLARCGAWRWRPGMLTLSGLRVTSACGRDASGVLDPAYHEVSVSRDDAPDLRDAATRGAVLDLARAIWRDETLRVEAYTVTGNGQTRIAWRLDALIAEVGDLYDLPSEADALVDAVLAGSERGDCGLPMLTMTAADALAALEAAGGGE